MSFPFNPFNPVPSLFRIPSLLATITTIHLFQRHFFLSTSDNLPYIIPLPLLNLPYTISLLNLPSTTFLTYLVGINSFILPIAADLTELLLYFYIPPTTNLGRYVAVAFIDFLALPLLIAARILISDSPGPSYESRFECVEPFRILIFLRVLFIIPSFLFYTSIIKYEVWAAKPVPPDEARGKGRGVGV
ncbi:hypothetical protein ACLOAV_006293 [Pseudogymnoascus australis]